MKYKLTPANGLCLFLAGVIFFLQYESAHVRNKFAASYLLCFLIFTSIIDLFLQLVIKNYKNLIFTEITVLMIVIAVMLAA